GAPSRAASAGPSPRAWPPHSDPVLRRPPQSPATDEPGRHPSPPGLPHVPARRPNPDAMPPPQASFLSRKSRLLKNYRLPTAEIPVRRSLPQAVGITRFEHMIADKAGLVIRQPERSQHPDNVIECLFAALQTTRLRN